MVSGAWGISTGRGGLRPAARRLLPLMPIPLPVGACFGGLFVALRRAATHAPYLLAVALFLLGYGISPAGP